jgi:hypothetical protein
MELAMSNVIPMDPKKRIEASLQPASPSEAQAAVAMLAKALPIMPSIQDPQAFKGIMAEFLAAYPADVLIAAVDQAVQKFKHMPSTAEMIELCKGLVHPRREALNRLERIEYENQHEAERRRTERAAEAEREAAEEARRQATIRWLRGIEERARERLGDAAPLPGDVAFAYSISKSVVSRSERSVSWHEALKGGELWAAQYCRLMALAERTRQAIRQGRIAWDECLAIAKLISRDEAAARSAVEQAEARAARPKYESPPPESFWDALYRIRKECGIDVPRSKDPDAVATAAETAKHLAALAGLADVRKILDRQVQEAWASKPHLTLTRPEPAGEQE